MKLITRLEHMRRIPARLRARPTSEPELAAANLIDKIHDGELTRQAVRDAMTDIPRLWPREPAPDWTMFACDECGEDSEVLVHFGAEPDYDVQWQDLCLSCLEKAVDLVKSANVQPSDG